jgi:hypothetical protein
MLVKNNGGATSYYDVPKNSKTLNDLIEHKNMAFWRGEAFKALYALEERATRSNDASSSEERELNKVIYYCNRRLNMLNQLKVISDD